jgi:CRP/FNR family cyclic AMP-dependent transcriptional regulator
MATPSFPSPTPPIGAGAPPLAGAAAHGLGERLQDLPPELAADLLRVGSRRVWRRGQVVVRQGTHSQAIMVGLQGRLAATLGRADGHDTLLRWLDDGELVGLADALAGMPAPVSVVAHGAASTLHVGREAFIRLLRQHPDGAISVAVLLSRRLGELFRYIEMTGSQPLADRVAFALQRLARSQGQADGAGGTRLKITQADLAAAAGASRQRVHLALQRMRADGRITLGYGWVTLLPT